VFFSVDDGVHGREPWVTDGTTAGTQLLVETGSGTAGSGATNFLRFGSTTRFFALGGIWSTDGTPAGTMLDIPLESYRIGVAVASSAFYFFGYDSVHGFEPWKSDGTAAGTSMIKEIRRRRNGRPG
jgi:ELWxxDGT repeat protein